MESKDWTVGDALGSLRVLTNQVDTSKVRTNFWVS